MQVLFQSIYSKFTGSTGAGSLHALLGGRLHLGKAPQGSTYPYGVYHEISDVPEYVFGTTNLEHTLIQFNLYDDDNSATDINAVYTALTGLYDHAAMTVSTGYSSVIIEREFSYLSRGETLWDYNIRYRFILQKN